MPEFIINNIVIPTHIIERWQSFVNTISEFVSVPSAMINRLDPPELEIFRASTNADNPFPTGTRMPLMGVYCETAARKRQKVVVTDARKDPVWSKSPTAEAGIYAYLGYPLMWPDGNVFGTLCVVDTKENKWGKQYETLMQSFKETVETHLALVHTIEQLDIKNKQLQHALDEVITLRGLLPICAYCKKIRDDKGYWNQIECYIRDRSYAEFSHSICPDCLKIHFPECADNYKSDDSHPCKNKAL